MKIITTLAILAIMTSLGAVAVASMIPIDEVSARGGSANGNPEPNSHANNQGTQHAYSKTPSNQPCSFAC